MSVLEKLISLIDAKGPLNFADYMHYALYDKDYGYYTNNINAINAQGDFITAPEISSLFGRTLANQCIETLQKVAKPAIVEFGAGSGKLCVDILTRLKELDIDIVQYYIVEVSGKLKFNQQDYIKTHLPDWSDKVVWLDSIADVELNGVIIANEVLDAMPVKRFLLKDNKVYESFIFYKNVSGTNENSTYELYEEFRLSEDEYLIDLVNQKLPKNISPYTSEVNLFIEPWLTQCSKILNQGLVLLIDYGFTESEYYHPDRCMGTLMCHHKHKAHTDPLINVGSQDITAHVDFTHVAECAVNKGFHVAGFTSQACFLVNNDILGFVDNIEDERDKFTLNQAIKTLTHPAEMGELFKVMALTKDIDSNLAGFKSFDRRRAL